MGKVILFGLWIVSFDGHSVAVTKPVLTLDECKGLITKSHFVNRSKRTVLACIPQYIFEAKK